jgi:signal-transduction protein with cAMP-binding, CBS, and nucleotidyltransferase domain
MPKKSKRSLQDVVGKETYEVWVDMLRELVPEGRTHRLSVVAAGMLEYAVDKSMLIKHRNEEEHSVAMSLIDATDTSDPDSIKELIHDVVDRLFKDAGVKYERVSKRGERYSIADEIYNEFSCWYDYPWD